MWAKQFENRVNKYRNEGKDINENEKFCDTLDVSEDLFCKEELATVMKELENNKAPGFDNLVA